MIKRWVDYLLGVPLVWILSLSKKRKSGAPPAHPKKILVIKLAAIGDTILLIPILRSLRDSFPEAEIHWVVSDINRSIAETVSYVDRLWVWSGGSLPSFLRLLLSLRREQYDVVIDFEQWARLTALLTFFTGARTRLGFETKGQHRGGVFTATSPKSQDEHEIYSFYNLLELLRPQSRDIRLELTATAGGENELTSFLSRLEKKHDSGPLVLLHPGCGADGLPREWPLVKFAVLGNWLLTKQRAEIFISGGPEERMKTAALAKLLNHRAVDLGGKLSWQGTVSLIKHMDLVISGNTGVMHIAAALQKPQVALHGPTNARLWGPLNPRARVIESSCERCPCLVLGFEYHRKDQSCMNKIEVDQVKEAVSALIDKPVGI